jgi:hypothetical protein
MGKQIGLHMRDDDCRKLISFIRERDPVIISDWVANRVQLDDIRDPCRRGGWYCCWNQSILTELVRQPAQRQESVMNHYSIDGSLPVIELSYPTTEQKKWNGRNSQTQGRIWAPFHKDNKKFNLWVAAISRWVRKNFRKNPVPLLSGYIGPEAFEWYLQGGLLLPMIRPPVTSQWVSWADAQDQHRKVFAPNTSSPKKSKS